MPEVALILVGLLVGILLRASGRLPDAAPKVLVGWVINVALPATALVAVHDVTISEGWWLAAASPWLGALLAVAVFVPLCRWLGWSKQRLGALILVGGWGNTSFVGLPMIAAYAGSQWMGLGLVIDLFGSYLALSLLGIAIATLCSGEHWTWRSLLRRVATFPPFLAILLALATNHLERPESLTFLLQAFSDTLTPLAMAAVGYAIRIGHLGKHLAPLVAGLGYRLLLAPLAAYAIYRMAGMMGDPVTRVALLEMAMPPMLGASAIALDHDLEPDLVALMIGIGIPLSMLTAPLWWQIAEAAP